MPASRCAQTGSYPRSKAPLQRRPDDWGHEYLDMIIAAKTVGSIDEAINPYPDLRVEPH